MMIVIHCTELLESILLTILAMASQHESKCSQVVFDESERFQFPEQRPADAVLRANTRGVESLAFLQHAEEPPSSHAATLGMPWYNELFARKCLFSQRGSNCVAPCF